MRVSIAFAGFVSLVAMCFVGGCSGVGTPRLGGDTGITGGASSPVDAAETGGGMVSGSVPSGGARTGGVAATGGLAATGGVSVVGGALTGGSALGGLVSGGIVATGGAGTGGLRDAGVAETAGTDGPVGTGGVARTGGVLILDASTGTGGTVRLDSAVAADGDSVPLPAKFVGNITTGNSIDLAGLPFARYWDQITPENAGKWMAVQASVNAAYNWGALDAIYDYARKNNVLFKEHTFVWGSAMFSGTITETHVRNWMKAFCERYPETKLIDVVNEPPPHTTPNFANAIGGGTNGDWKWIANSFIWVKEACPKAILILNDYHNIEYADQNAHFIDIANQVLAQGAPLHALGAEAHYAHKFDAATVKGFLDKLHDQTGLPVYITEYDVPLADDTAQLNKYQEQIPLFMETDYVKGVTIWGWRMGSTWVSNSGLVSGTTFRPAMTWLMGYLGRPTTP